MKTYEKKTIRGHDLWKMTSAGKRGGKDVAWAARRQGDDAPTGWELWCGTAKQCIDDGGGYLSTAGAVPHAGIFR